MSEESIDEFLKKVVTERRPLTDQEKREAMIEAWKVRDAAKRKISVGKELAILKKEEQYVRLTITVDRLKTESSKPTWAPQDWDVSINVMREENVGGMMIPARFDLYFISSSSVVKQTMIPPQNTNPLEGTLSNDKLKQIDDKSKQREAALRKKTYRSREQAIQEIYHPDKTDLANLLQNLSSAKQI